MNDSELVFYVKCHVRPECVDAWREAVGEVIERMSQEDSFVACHLHVDAQDPTLFTLYERWAEPSVEAFLQHQDTPYRRAYEDRLPALLRGPREPQVLVPLGAWRRRTPEPPVDRTINYVELPARDLDAVKAFYAQVFGWRFTDYGPDYAAFHDGRTDGGFYRSEAASRVDGGAALVVLYAEELERTRDAVVAAGGRVVQEIFAFPGGRRFHFADPAGNELAVWSH